MRRLQITRNRQVLDNKIKKDKKNKKTMIAFVLTFSLLTGCAMNGQSGKDGVNAETDSGTGQSVGETAENSAGEAEISGRPFLLQNMAEDEEESVVPCVSPYTVAPDLSNIENMGLFYIDTEGGIAEKLSQNGFCVVDLAGNEFFEIYEMNRYDLIPNFVTVDSLMHTYHLYFSHLLKKIEKNHLTENLAQLSRRMLENSLAQYEALKGSEWESAAARNAAFFAVGASLLGEEMGNIALDDAVLAVADYELQQIKAADGIAVSQVTGEYEDYSQYKPRGYYEGDKDLEPYFRAMMWYGRIPFRQENEDTDRSALLMTLALLRDAQAYGLWESVYAVTSFFAGASDDLGVCEYAPVIREAYGEGVTVSALVENEEDFLAFHGMTATLPAPQINSIPIRDGEENTVPGFRFMGQRFTIDAAIMQRLIYSDVGENNEGGRRMLPDVLDVPAALGSSAALGILESGGAADYSGYSENMKKLKSRLAEADATLWSASLYSGWLNTLRPLLTVKGDGYPMFMQNEEWTKKDLECFAGSYTELKHDTVLYSKQVIAEMGGGYSEEFDDRGYVQPEPLVYGRFARLAEGTAQGLKEYGLLNDGEEENLTRLSEMARQMQTISNKELLDELLTDEEYEFIRCYGGNIEHFWYEAVKDEAGSEEISTQELPAAVVVDVATDPNGSVLEAATGKPSKIYVAIKVDGKVKLATGSVYSFYQFAWPLNDRLTDNKWRQMMGFSPDEEGYFNTDGAVEKPEWTKSYRYFYEWE